MKTKFNFGALIVTLLSILATYYFPAFIIILFLQLFVFANIVRVEYKKGIPSKMYFSMAIIGIYYSSVAVGFQSQEDTIRMYSNIGNAYLIFLILLDYVVQLFKKYKEAEFSKIRYFP